MPICDVCCKETPNTLVMCDDCDPNVDGHVAGPGSGARAMQDRLVRVATALRIPTPEALDADGLEREILRRVEPVTPQGVEMAMAEFLEDPETDGKPGELGRWFCGRFNVTRKEG